MRRLLFFVQSGAPCPDAPFSFRFQRRTASPPYSCMKGMKKATRGRCQTPQREFPYLVEIFPPDTSYAGKWI